MKIGNDLAEKNFVPGGGWGWGLGLGLGRVGFSLSLRISLSRFTSLLCCQHCQLEILEALRFNIPRTGPSGGERGVSDEIGLLVARQVQLARVWDTLQTEAEFAKSVEICRRICYVKMFT